MKITMPVAGLLTLGMFAIVSMGIVYAQSCSPAPRTSDTTEQSEPVERPDPVVAVTDETFAKHVTEAEGYVVVDFWASWCGPCIRLKPIYKKIATDYAEAEKPLKFTALDVDANRSTAGKYAIRSIPTLIMFKDGEVVDRRVGGATEDKLREWITKHVK